MKYDGSAEMAALPGSRPTDLFNKARRQLITPADRRGPRARLNWAVIRRSGTRDDPVLQLAIVRPTSAVSDARRRGSRAGYTEYVESGNICHRMVSIRVESYGGAFAQVMI